MAVNLSPVGGVAAQFFTNSGAPLTGGKIFTYAAGTTTPQASYTTSQGNVPWTNPIVLDAAGRVPSGGEIWLTDGLIYKFILKDANDVLIATYDNITGINSNSVAFVNQQEIVTATAGQTVFNLGISYQPATNSLSVFVDGVNQYGPGAQYSYVETDSNTVTFNAGLHVGAEVKFTTTQQQSAGAVDAQQVTYDPPFTGSVATNVEAKLAQTVSVKDFGAVGDGVTNDTAAIQAAVNQVCSVEGILYFPAGDYRIKSSITFTNKSFIICGAGPTATVIAADPTTPNITLFDFSGCTGPAKVIRDISFNGPAPSVYGGTAVKAYGNGFLFDNVWFRGILVGLDAQGSFVNTDNCVAEYCYEAAKASTALDESMWRGWTMYKNETDFILGGDNKTFTIRDTNCIATKTKVFDVSCNGALIDGVTVQNDGTAYTPDIFEINGSQNVINNVLINSFGNRGFFFQGASVVRNRISNVMIYNIANGILFSQASRNSVSNITIRDCQTGYGVYFDTCTDNLIENFLFQGNNYNVQISAANDNALYNGQMVNAQTADFYFPVTNADRLFVGNVRANFAGIATLPYKMQTLSGGQKQVMASAAPTTGAWAVGDSCVNSAPAVGQPKGWRCTVAGTPGTWVSEGNL